MIDVVLALHFIGLMMGAGGGLGSMVAMAKAGKLPPEQAGPIRSLGPTLARLSLSGLILMWATGLALVFLKYGGVSALPVLFWVKIAFVLMLTLAASLIEITHARVKRGDTKAAALLPRLGPLAGMSSLLAVIFAALAFH